MSDEENKGEVKLTRQERREAKRKRVRKSRKRVTAEGRVLHTGRTYRRRIGALPAGEEAEMLEKRVVAEAPARGGLAYLAATEAEETKKKAKKAKKDKEEEEEKRELSRCHCCFFFFVHTTTPSVVRSFTFF